MGVTDITVEYSSPGVKGRKVWGDLVPLDKPWRTGANASTKITFSKDVTFGGKPVPAGTYAIVATPTQKGWTVSLNKELGLWQGKHVRGRQGRGDSVPATTTTIPGARAADVRLLQHDRHRHLARPGVGEAARLRAHQGGHRRAREANIKQLAGAGVARAHQRRPLRGRDHQGPRHGAEVRGHRPSPSSSNWYNHWIKADILAQKGNYAEARKFAQVSWDLGQKDAELLLQGHGPARRWRTGRTRSSQRLGLRRYEPLVEGLVAVDGGRELEALQDALTGAVREGPPASRVTHQVEARSAAIVPTSPSGCQVARLPVRPPAPGCRRCRWPPRERRSSSASSAASPKLSCSLGSRKTSDGGEQLDEVLLLAQEGHAAPPGPARAGWRSAAERSGPSPIISSRHGQLAVDLGEDGHHVADALDRPEVRDVDEHRLGVSAGPGRARAGTPRGRSRARSAPCPRS